MTTSIARTKTLRSGVAIAAAALLLLAGAAEAGGKRDRGHRKHQTSCKPSYSNHYGHYRSSRHHHRHRDYRKSHSRSGVSISIGGGYSSRSSYGGYSRSRYHFPRYTSSRYSTCSPVRRTDIYYSSGSYRPAYAARTTYVRPVVRPVILSERSTGTLYTSAPTRPAYTSTTTRVETVSPGAGGWELEEAAPLVVENTPQREVVSGRLDETQPIEIVGTTEEGVVYAIPPADLSVVEPVEVASASETTTVVVAQAESEPRLDRPWRELLEGSPAVARALFADTVRAEPENAEARLGFIIAALRDGDRAAAASSMIRLLEEQPTLVRAGNLPESEALIRELARLSEELHRYEGHGVKQWERRMLIAFTDFLRGSIASGQDAMRASRRAGAKGVAPRNMWRLLGLSDKPLERVVRR